MDLRFLWSLLVSRLPVMLALVIICTAFGAVTALRLPSTYSTSARLLVEAPQIVEGRQSVTPAGEMLQVIEQQLLTRANLIDVANKFGVFAGESPMTPDEVVAKMRERTRITRSAGRDQATLMVVSYTAPRAQVAADVVNEYVTLILSANSRERIGRAETALGFYEQEVARLGADLDQQSARIVEFKNTNAGALPDDLQYRQNRQSLLQERLGRLDSDKAALVKQRADVVRLYETTGNIQSSAIPQTPEQQELGRLQSELRQVLGVYAEGSPRVKALRARIATAEKAVQDAVGVTPEGGEAIPAGPPVLEVALSEIDSRLQALDTEMANTNTELAAIETSLAATSANAIALAALERDHANIQTRYNAAVASLNEARTSERIETAQQGQRITVIESANVPNQPSGPNRPMIAAIGAGLGLGLAAAFFVLMELLNRSLRHPAELRQRFGITPIAVIPYIDGKTERRQRRLVRLGAIVAVVVLIPLGLWVLHVNYMPLDMLTQKVMNRLGLN